MKSPSQAAISWYRKVSRKWKRKRFEHFLEVVRPARGSTVIDLGGGEGLFFKNNMDLVERGGLCVVVADISAESLARAEANGFDTLRLEEGGIGSIDDGAFDAVFCNSVIEHVTVPKSEVWSCTGQDFFDRAYAEQKRFAAHIERIARAYYVQTPCISFPIESHSWLPKPYIYPRSRAKHVERVKRCNGFWVKKTQPDYNLLDMPRFKALFPGATDVLCNRVLGIPKELIAYRRAG